VATKVMQCKCEHEYQDKKYGKNLRLHNSTIKEGGGWRCTVCGAVKGK
jgi:hypothetical protein